MDPVLVPDLVNYFWLPTSQNQIGRTGRFFRFGLPFVFLYRGMAGLQFLCCTMKWISGIRICAVATSLCRDFVRACDSILHIATQIGEALMTLGKLFLKLFAFSKAHNNHWRPSLKEKTVFNHCMGLDSTKKVGCPSGIPEFCSVGCVGRQGPPWIGKHSFVSSLFGSQVAGL